MPYIRLSYLIHICVSYSELPSNISTMEISANLIGRIRPSYVSIKEVSLWLQAARWYTRSTCHTARGRGRIRSPPGIGNLNNRKNVVFFYHAKVYNCLHRLLWHFFLSGIWLVTGFEHILKIKLLDFHSVFKWRRVYMVTWALFNIQSELWI